MISGVKSFAAAVLSGILAAPLFGQPAPHAAHVGRYGGAFAAASGDSLHVEAVWTEQRRIRFFLTDASGDPLPLERLRNIDVTTIAGGVESAAVLIELDSHFEARIPTLRLPATITVRFTAPATAPAELLQFTFEDYTQRIDDIPRASPSEVPSTLAGILRALADDRAAVQSIYAERVDAGRIFPIEERIRERVLAIEPYLAPLPAERRGQAQAAIMQVVRSCWLLHTSMDHGNDAQLDAAVTQFSTALTRIQSVLAAVEP